MTGSGGDGDKRVLVAIVNWQRPELTATAARSMIASGLPEGSLVLVVDDESTPAGRAELARTVGPGAEIVAQEANAGYGAACNRALERAARDGYPYCLLMNNDVEFGDRVVERLLAHLATDSNLAAVSPVTVSMSTEESVLAAGVDVDLWRGRVHRRLQGQPLDTVPLRPYGVTALEGACILVRTSAAMHVGGFDEAFFLYWEDTEWTIRLRRAGYGLAVVPTAVVRHQESASAPARVRQELLIRNRVRFVRCVGSPAEQFTFMLWFLIAWLPAFTVMRLIPRYGLRSGTMLAVRAVAWNVKDAIDRGRWRIDPPPRPR